MNRSFAAFGRSGRSPSIWGDIQSSKLSFLSFYLKQYTSTLIRFNKSNLKNSVKSLRLYKYPTTLVSSVGKNWPLVVLWSFDFALFYHKESFIGAAKYHKTCRATELTWLTVSFNYVLVLEDFVLRFPLPKYLFYCEEIWKQTAHWLRNQITTEWENSQPPKCAYYVSSQFHIA